MDVFAKGCSPGALNHAYPVVIQSFTAAFPQIGGKWREAPKGRNRGRRKGEKRGFRCVSLGKRYTRRPIELNICLLEERKGKNAFPTNGKMMPFKKISTTKFVHYLVFTYFCARYVYLLPRDIHSPHLPASSFPITADNKKSQPQPTGITHLLYYTFRNKRLVIFSLCHKLEFFSVVSG